MVGFYVAGDSMEPELHEGDIVIAEYPTEQPALRLFKEGELYVVTTPDWEDYIKRYHFDTVAKEDTLVSANPMYGPIPVPGPKQVRFVGQVKKVIKRKNREE